MYLSRIIASPVLLPCRRWRRSSHTPLTGPRYSTYNPTSDVPSSDQQRPSSNIRLARLESDPGIWMMKQRQVGAHRPGRPLLILCGPPPPPGVGVSSPPPLYTSTWQEGSCPYTDRVRIFCTWDSKGRGGYPPPGPLLCPTHGGEKSGFRGWSEFRPTPEILLQGLPPISLPWISRPSNYGVLTGGGGGGPPGNHFQLSVVPGDVSQVILMQGTPCTWERRPFGTVDPGVSCTPPPSNVCTTPLNAPQWRGKAGRPCLLSSWSFSAEQPNQRAPSRRQTPVEVLPLARTWGGCCRRRSMLTYVEQPRKIPPVVYHQVKYCGGAGVALVQLKVALKELFHPKMPPLISLSITQKKQFLLCRK